MTARLRPSNCALPRVLFLVLFLVVLLCDEFLLRDAIAYKSDKR